MKSFNYPLSMQKIMQFWGQIVDSSEKERAALHISPFIKATSLTFASIYSLFLQLIL